MISKSAVGPLRGLMARSSALFGRVLFSAVLGVVLIIRLLSIASAQGSARISRIDSVSDTAKSAPRETLGASGDHFVDPRSLEYLVTHSTAIISGEIEAVRRDELTEAVGGTRTGVPLLTAVFKRAELLKPPLGQVEGVSVSQRETGALGVAKGNTVIWFLDTLPTAGPSHNVTSLVSGRAGVFGVSADPSEDSDLYLIAVNAENNRGLWTASLWNDRTLPQGGVITFLKATWPKMPDKRREYILSVGDRASEGPVPFELLIAAVHVRLNPAPYLTARP